MLGLNFFCNDSAELVHDVGLFSRNNEEAGPKYMKKHCVYTFFLTTLILDQCLVQQIFKEQ